MSPTERKPKLYRLYGLLDHPVRARILSLLREKGALSFTELKKETQVSVGSLYYHLSILGDMVGRDTKNRYLISDLGTAAHEKLTERARDDQRGPERKIPFFDRLAPVLSGTVIFQGISLSPLRHSIEAVLILVLGSIITSSSDLSNRMFFVFESNLAGGSLVVSFLGSWLAIYLGSNLLSTVLFRRRTGNLSLGVSSTYSLVPMTIFVLIWLNQNLFPLSLLTSVDGWPLRILFFILQAWSLLLLSSALRVSKRLEASKAYMIVLLLLYGNIAFTLVETVP